MLKAARFVPAAIVLLLASAATLFSQALSTQHPNQNPKAPSIHARMAFEANRGQTAPQVQYLARSREGESF